VAGPDHGPQAPSAGAGSHGCAKSARP
jgi:hypothetical protein